MATLGKGLFVGTQATGQAGLTLQCGQSPWGHGGAVAGAGRAKEMGRLGVMLKRWIWDKLSQTPVTHGDVKLGIGPWFYRQGH